MLPSQLTYEQPMKTRKLGELYTTHTTKIGVWHLRSTGKFPFYTLDKVFLRVYLECGCEWLSVPYKRITH